jgi:hypothetical protein
VNLIAGSSAASVSQPRIATGRAVAIVISRSGFFLVNTAPDRPVSPLSDGRVRRYLNCGKPFASAAQWSSSAPGHWILIAAAGVVALDHDGRTIEDNHINLFPLCPGDTLTHRCTKTEAKHTNTSSNLISDSRMSGPLPSRPCGSVNIFKIQTRQARLDSHFFQFTVQSHNPFIDDVLTHSRDVVFR